MENTSFFQTERQKKVAAVQVFTDGSAVKNPPAMQETQKTRVQSLDQEDPLEEGMATYSGILAWRIPWTEEPVGTHTCVETMLFGYGFSF